MFKDLVYQARSYRRFREDKDVSPETLTELVDAARMCPSSVNFQVQRYAVSTSREMNAKIFPHLAWARQLKDWPGPAEGERPAAYIVIGCDAAHPHGHKIDTGIAAQTLQLGLADAGLACCMLANINAKAIHNLVGFPDEVVVTLVLAIGYPGETIVVEELLPGQSPAYWRAEDDSHHVPKRRLQDILLAKFT